MAGDEELPEDVYEARLALQGIITCQVVLKDTTARDKLIAEGVERHGMRLVHSAAGFINANAATDVDESVAESRFFYLLTRLGDLCTLLAQIEDLDVSDVFHQLAAIDFEYESEEDREQVLHAMRAAQTCLVAQHFVRRGGAPWGIQQTLRLDDMSAVVSMLGYLLLVVLDWFEEALCADLVRLLLKDVEMILRAQARANGCSVSDQVTNYFVRVMENDIS